MESEKFENTPAGRRQFRRLNLLGYVTVLVLALTPAVISWTVGFHLWWAVAVVLMIIGVLVYVFMPAFWYAYHAHKRRKADRMRPLTAYPLPPPVDTPIELRVLRDRK